jgi:uncharacterized protein
MNKIRIVLDSNIILSAALFKKSIPRQALDKAVATGQILMSTDTLAEIQDIFNRPKFDKYISKAARDEFLKDFIETVENVEIMQSFSACRDSKDDKFLELSVNGKADYLITGDRDLLVLHPFRDIQILTPADFLTNIP